MAEFIMTIGIPGCGKSTWASEQEKEGYKVHSSDAYRIETGIKSAGSVFPALMHRIVNDLRDGKNCILDATNMSRKNRRGILQEVGRTDSKKICMLFLTPISVCEARNAKREGEARVPDHVFLKMMKQFQPPTAEEGFDEIRLMGWEYPYEMPYDHVDLMAFNQDNEHHSRTLGAHMQAAGEYVSEHYPDEPLLLEAAKWHDIGKFLTKSFQNAKGEPTQDAHYYEHHNVGAFLYLLEWQRNSSLPFSDALHVANLISMHMHPFMSWKQSEKARERDCRLFGSAFCAEIDRLHQADMVAK